MRIPVRVLQAYAKRAHMCGVAEGKLEAWEEGFQQGHAAGVQAGSGLVPQDSINRAVKAAIAAHSAPLHERLAEQDKIKLESYQDLAYNEGYIVGQRRGFRRALKLRAAALPSPDSGSDSDAASSGEPKGGKRGLTAGYRFNSPLDPSGIDFDAQRALKKRRAARDEKEERAAGALMGMARSPAAPESADKGGEGEQEVRASDPGAPVDQPVPHADPVPATQDQAMGEARGPEN